MGTFIRLFLSAPLAALITIVIFLGLYNQLSPKPFLYTTQEEPNTVYFGIDELYPPIIICLDCGWVRLPEKPDTSNPWSDSEKAVKEAPQVDGASCDLDCPAVNVELDISKPPQKISGDVFLPQYPEACIQKGVEGVVTVRFDVTPEGRVINIVILETPDDCFIRPVISTLQKWRYQPQFGDDGRPNSRSGVIESFRYQLTD